jgi:hypothetical protein
MLGFFVFTRLNPNFLLCWLLGAFCYFLVSRPVMGLGFFGLFLALVGAGISQFQSDSSSVLKADLGFLMWLPSRKMGSLILSCGIGLVLADVCHREPRSPFLIKMEWIGTRLAAFSYTLYLTHYPLLDLWNYFLPERSTRFDAGSLALFACKVLSCLVLGWLVYLPFEARTGVVKDWMKRRLNLRPQQA